ncbi:unnamed protein product [Lactuca virosa]|uniref:Uncharacterized protein n=1 Tax=Lactuca virosa TaxID=75947 RepID=A0AAU9LU70_9ASTR|nr:unnamed protein product [Lactuca virosa]
MEMQQKTLLNGSEGSENPRQLHNNVDKTCTEDQKSSETRSEYSQSDPSAGDASEGGCSIETAVAVADVSAGNAGGGIAADGVEDCTKTAPATTEGVVNDHGTTPNGGSNGGAQPEDGGIRVETALSAGGGDDDVLGVDLNFSYKSDSGDGEQAAEEAKDGAEVSSVNVAGGAGAANGDGPVMPAKKRIKSECNGDKDPPVIHGPEEDGEGGGPSVGGGSGGVEQPKYGIRLFGFDI